MTVKLLTEQILEFLSLTRGCTGSAESTLVKMPHCWESHVTALIYLQVCTRGVTVVPGGHQVRWAIFSSCYNETRQDGMTSTMFSLILKVRSIVPD